VKCLSLLSMLYVVYHMYIYSIFVISLYMHIYMYIYVHIWCMTLLQEDDSQYTQKFFSCDAATGVIDKYVGHWGGGRGGIKQEQLVEFAVIIGDYLVCYDAAYQERVYDIRTEAAAAEGSVSETIQLEVTAFRTAFL
jgi:hypothetical protein